MGSSNQQEEQQHGGLGIRGWKTMTMDILGGISPDNTAPRGS